MDRVFSQQSIAYDLIVGPKGSDMQLVLNTVYRVGSPLQNLPYLYYEELKKDPRIETAIPFCLGDATEKGAFPIVGTTEEYSRTSLRAGRDLQVEGRGLHEFFRRDHRLRGRTRKWLGHRHAGQARHPVPADPWRGRIP